MLVINCIVESWVLEGEEVEEYFTGFIDCGSLEECEETEQDIKYKNFIFSYQGVNVYYDFGADYYFFERAKQ